MLNQPNTLKETKNSSQENITLQPISDADHKDAVSLPKAQETLGNTYEIENKKPETIQHILCKKKFTLEREIITAANANTTLYFFNRLPAAILENYLLSDLHLTDDKKTTGLLGLVSRSGTLFQKQQINIQVNALSQAVVYAQYDEVKKILDGAAKYSLPLLEKLLTTPVEIIDYSGRHVYGNPLQLALGAGDVSRPTHPDEGMAELILSFYKRLPSGKSLKQAHISEFNKYAEITSEQNTKDLSVIEKIFQDIAKADDDCAAALQVFRDYLEPDPKKLIKGKCFNHNMLIRAYELYERYYADFNGWNSHKNNLVWQKVIGYLQRFLPACDGQIFCQNPRKVVVENELLIRSLELHYNANLSFFPLSKASSGLGYEYACEWGLALSRAPAPAAWPCPTYSMLMSIKNERISTFGVDKPPDTLMQKIQRHFRSFMY